jgi:hypothetical protein
MTVDEIYERLLEAKRKPDEKDYGGTVLPAFRVYSSLRTTDEFRAYQNALERMLTSEDMDLRHWAVTVCLGFVVFHDAIDEPKLQKRAKGQEGGWLARMFSSK